MEHFIQFIIEHWMLWLALALILILLIQSEYESTQGDVMGLSPQEVTLKLNKQAAIVIDLRDKVKLYPYSSTSLVDKYLIHLYSMLNQRLILTVHIE